MLTDEKDEVVYVQRFDSDLCKQNCKSVGYFALNALNLLLHAAALFATTGTSFIIKDQPLYSSVNQTCTVVWIIVGCFLWIPTVIFFAYLFDKTSVKIKYYVCRSSRTTYYSGIIHVFLVCISQAIGVLALRTYAGVWVYPNTMTFLLGLAPFVLPVVTYYAIYAIVQTIRCAVKLPVKEKKKIALHALFVVLMATNSCLQAGYNLIIRPSFDMIFPFLFCNIFVGIAILVHIIGVFGLEPKMEEFWVTKNWIYTILIVNFSTIIMHVIGMLILGKIIPTLETFYTGLLVTLALAAVEIICIFLYFFGKWLKSKCFVYVKIEG